MSFRCFRVASCNNVIDVSCNNAIEFPLRNWCLEYVPVTFMVDANAFTFAAWWVVTTCWAISWNWHHQKLYGKQGYALNPIKVYFDVVWAVGLLKFQWHFEKISFKLGSGLGLVSISPESSRSVWRELR